MEIPQDNLVLGEPTVVVPHQIIPRPNFQHQIIPRPNNSPPNNSKRNYFNYLRNIRGIIWWWIVAYPSSLASSAQSITTAHDVPPSLHWGLLPSSFVFNFQIPLKPRKAKIPALCPYLQGERREKLSSASGKISHVGLFLFRKLSNAIYQLITGLHLCPLIPLAVFHFWKCLCNSGSNCPGLSLLSFSFSS